jgi:hypothetical protein
MEKKDEKAVFYNLGNSLDICPDLDPPVFQLDAAFLGIYIKINSIKSR